MFIDDETINISTSNNQAKLYKKAVSRKDAGTYELSLKNSLGSSVAEVEVDVLGMSRRFGAWMCL